MKNLRKAAIYRVVLGPYDRAIEDNVSREDYDLFLFTDIEQRGFTNYERKMLPTTELPALKNRELKINVPKCLRDYDVVIYVDANIQICKNIDLLLDEFLASDADFGFFRHPYSNNIEEEIQAVLSNRKAMPEILNKELEALNYTNGAISREPVTDNSIIFRKNFSRWDLFAFEWYSYVQKYTGRDQISLPFLREKHKLTEHVFSWSPRNITNKYFVVFPHQVRLEKSTIGYFKSFLLFIKKSFESRFKQL